MQTRDKIILWLLNTNFPELYSIDKGIWKSMGAIYWKSMFKNVIEPSRTEIELCTKQYKVSIIIKFQIGGLYACAMYVNIFFSSFAVKVD